MAFRADRLRERIQATSIAPGELAEAVGVSERMIRDYKSGRGVPASEHLTRLADAVKTNTDYLMDRTSYPGPLTALHYKLADAFERGDRKGIEDLLRQHLLEKGIGKKPITRK